ncbi:hypothetical protein [Reinekea sp. G2M2-21]|uniref:hypothetical protein n=1 Tax=Reinekea sp. G2M2-21 TaxID=2788942 RepID=UPI0018ABABB3|nr:hypothetical protein [Reinekea sp. G2M2-21]
MTTYLKLSNVRKEDIDEQTISAFLELAESDNRVTSIKRAGDLFEIDAQELKGCYSLGRIAGHLHESNSEIDARKEREKLPDIVHIKKLRHFEERSYTDRRSLFTFTKNKMNEYSNVLPPSADRAQCINIANYKLLGNESIADRLVRDHKSTNHALRAALLMVAAGCANHIDRVKGRIGKIIFEDGSEL